MASSKPQKKTRLKKAAVKSASNPITGVVGTSVLVVLFLMAQIICLKGNPVLGMGISLFVALIWLAGFFDLFNPRINFNPAKETPSTPRASGASPSKSKLKWDVSKPLFNARDFYRLLALLAALMLAGMGQFYWIQAARPATLAIGAFYYLGAVLLWIGALGPWFKEGPAESGWVLTKEKIIFWFVMALALFMRVYQLNHFPAGLFIDQGYEGYSALRILHEGWHPFYVEDIYHNYALVLYQIAAFFAVVGASDFTLKLFFVLMVMATFPLIYWTFRQLAGPRLALLSIFVLAVMRWNINFSRNAFPTVQVPFYMFGTLAFLIYGLKQGKRWAFVVSSLFFTAGLYTYQAFKVFPILLIPYALYELITNRKAVLANGKNILIFLGLAFALTFPVFHDMVLTHNLGTRESELSIMPQLKAQHSLRPFFNVLDKTALMFNRQGDPNPRHNLQDYRMLDDVSGALLILGLVYALARVRRREYFYAVVGFFIMSIPCIFSIDAAHANRMLGMTPFIAFLIAAPLSALWGQAQAWAGKMGERVFLGFLGLALVFMTAENFNVYFNLQATNYSSWSEYSITESSLGKAIGEKGPGYASFISPRYYNHYSVDFYAYKCLSELKPFKLPDSLVPLSVPGDHGLFYGFDSGRAGIIEALQTLYPQGKITAQPDPTGHPFLYFFEVPASVWGQCKGVKAQINGGAVTLLNQFPQGIPTGAARDVFSGSLFVGVQGNYSLVNHGGGRVQWQVGEVRLAGKAALTAGYVPIRITWSAPAGAAPLKLELVGDNGVHIPLDADNLTSLDVPAGLLAKYFETDDWSGKPSLEQQEPVLNYTNGNDFSVRGDSASWEGFLKITQGGVYHFSLAMDPNDEGKLVLDNKDVIRLSRFGSGTAELAPGRHSIQVYYRSDGMASITLYWTVPGSQTPQVVPFEAFE
jgi:Dolichyl-phosphate-mannose-protein mannosyltransferase/PA14 domain